MLDMLQIFPKKRFNEHFRSHRLKDSVKIHLKEVDWEDGDWIYLAEDREWCWAVVNVVMNFNIQLNTGNFLIS